MGVDFVKIERKRFDSLGRSYGGFHAFRKQIASLAGIELGKMDGFSGDAPGVSWLNYKHDPIIKFLDHSDCDGEIEYEDCAAIAPRLRELVSMIPDDGTELSKYNKTWGLRLAEAMTECAKDECDMEFC